MGGKFVQKGPVPRALGLLLIAFLVTLPALADGTSCRDMRERAISGRELTADTASYLMKQVARGNVLVLPEGLLPKGDDNDKENVLILSEALGLNKEVVPSYTTIDKLAYDDVDRAYVVLLCDAGDILDPAGQRFCAEWSFTRDEPWYQVPVCLSDLLRGEYLQSDYTSDTDFTFAENLCDYRVTSWDMITKGLDTTFGADLGVIEWAGRRVKDVREDGSLERMCQECEACTANDETCTCPKYPTSCDTSYCAREIVYNAVRSVNAMGVLRFMEPQVVMHVGKCKSLVPDKRRECLASKSRLLADMAARNLMELETVLSHTPLIRCRNEIRRVLEKPGECARCFDLALNCYENNLGHQIVRDKGSQEMLGFMEGTLRESMPWFYMTRDLSYGALSLSKSAATYLEGKDAVARTEYNARGQALLAFGKTRKEQAEAASRLFFGLYCMRACALRNPEMDIAGGPAGWMMSQFQSHDVEMAKRYGRPMVMTEKGMRLSEGPLEVGVPLVLGPSFRREDGSLDEGALARCPRGLLASMALGEQGGKIQMRQAKGTQGLPWKIHLAQRTYLACPHNQLPLDGDAPRDRAVLDMMGDLCEHGPYAREKGACAFDGRLAVLGSEVDTGFQTALWGATGVLLDSVHQSSFKSRIVHELVPNPAEIQSRVFGVVTDCTAPDAEPLIVTVAGGPIIARDADGNEKLGESGAWMSLDRRNVPLEQGRPPWFYTIRDLEGTVVTGRGRSIIEVAGSNGKAYPVISLLIGTNKILSNPYFRGFDPALIAGDIYEQSQEALPGADGGVCMHLYTGGYSKSGQGELLGHGATLLYGTGWVGGFARATRGGLAADFVTDAAGFAARNPFRFHTRLNRMVGDKVLSKAGSLLAHVFAREAAEGAGTAGAAAVRRGAGETAEEAGGAAKSFIDGAYAGKTVDDIMSPLKDIVSKTGDEPVTESVESLVRTMDAEFNRVADGAKDVIVHSPSNLAGKIWEDGAFTPVSRGRFGFSDATLKYLGDLDKKGMELVKLRLTGLGFNTDDVLRLIDGKTVIRSAGLKGPLKEASMKIAHTIGDVFSAGELVRVNKELTEILSSSLTKGVSVESGRQGLVVTRKGFESLGPLGQQHLRGLLKVTTESDDVFNGIRAAFKAGKATSPVLPANLGVFSDDLLRYDLTDIRRAFPQGTDILPDMYTTVAIYYKLRSIIAGITDPKDVRSFTYRAIEASLEGSDIGAVYARYLHDDLLRRGIDLADEGAVREAVEVAEEGFRGLMMGNMAAGCSDAYLSRTTLHLVEDYKVGAPWARDALLSAGVGNEIADAAKRVFSKEALQNGQPAVRDFIDTAVRKVNEQALDGGLESVHKASTSTAMKILMGIQDGIGTDTLVSVKNGLLNRMAHYSILRGIYRQQSNWGYGLDWTQPLFSYSADLWRLAPEGGAAGARFRDRERATLPLAVAGVCAAEGDDAVHIAPRCGEGADRTVCDGEWVPVSPDDELGKLQDAAVRSPGDCLETDPEEECLDGLIRILPDGRCVPFYHESEVGWLEYLDDYLRARRALLTRVRDDLIALRNALDQQCGRCLADVRVLGATYGGCTSTGLDAPPLIGNTIADHDEAGLSLHLADGLSYASAAALCTATCTQWEAFDVEACPLVTRVGSCMTEGDAIAPGAPGTEPAPSAEGIATCVRDVLRAKRACTLRGLRAFTSNVTWHGAPTADLGANLRPIIMEEGTDNPCGAIERLDEMDAFLDAYLTTLQGMEVGWERLQKASKCTTNAPYPDMDPCACVPFPEPGQASDETYRSQVALWTPRYDACVALENGEVAATLFEAAAYTDNADLFLDDFTLLLEQLVVAVRGDLEPGAADLLRDLYQDMPADALSEDAVAPVGMLWDIAHDMVVEADQQIPFVLSPKYDEGVLATLLDGECQCTGGDDTGCFQGIHGRGSPTCTAGGDLDEQCLGDRIADALRDRPLASVNGAVFGDEGVGVVPGSCTFACGNPTTGPNEQGTFPACVRCPDEIWSVNPFDCDVERPYPFDTLADRTAFIINASYPGPIPMVCSLKTADLGREFARRTLLQATIASIASLDVRRIFPDPECFGIEGGGLDPYERVHEEVSCQDACSMFRSPGGVPGSLYGYCRASVSADGTVSGECHCAWDDDPVGVHTGRPCPLPQGAAVYRAVQTHCRNEYGCRGFTNAFNAQEGRFACLCNGIGPLDVDLAEAVRDELSDLRVVRTIFEVEGLPVGPDGPHRAFLGEDVVGCAELENTGTGLFHGTVTSALVDRRDLVEGEEAVDEVTLSSGETVVVCTTPTAVSESLLGSGGAATLALRMSAMTGERSVLEGPTLGTPLRVAFGQPGLDEARMEGDVNDGATTVGARVYPVAVLRNNRNSPLDAMVTVAVVDESGRTLTTEAVPVAGVPPGESFTVEGGGHDVRVEDVGKRIRAKVTVFNDFGVPVLEETGGAGIRVVAPTLLATDVSFVDETESLRAASIGPCGIVSVNVVLENPTTVTFSGPVEVGLLHERSGTVLGLTRTHITVDAGDSDVLLSSHNVRPERQGTFRAYIRAVGGDDVPWRLVPGPAARTRLNVPTEHPCEGASAEDYWDDEGGLEEPGGTVEASTFTDLEDAPAWIPEKEVAEEGTEEIVTDTSVPDGAPVDVTCPDDPPSDRYDLVYCTGSACVTREDMNGGRYMRIEGCFCPTGITPRIEETVHGSKLSAETAACCVPCRASRAG